MAILLTQNLIDRLKSSEPDSSEYVDYIYKILKDYFGDIIPISDCYCLESGTISITWFVYNKYLTISIENERSYKHLAEGEPGIYWSGSFAINEPSTSFGLEKSVEDINEFNPEPLLKAIEEMLKEDEFYLAKHNLEIYK